MKPSRTAKAGIVLLGFSYILNARTEVYAIRAARLFDGVAGTLAEPGLVVVSGGRIQSVGGRAIPPGATVIDLGDATPLPGFIDAHTRSASTFKYGADVIKTCASGGVLSPTDDVDVPQLSQEELNALVDEAHTLRRKAAAHAHGAKAAKRAVRAGLGC